MAVTKEEPLPSQTVGHGDPAAVLAHPYAKSMSLYLDSKELLPSGASSNIRIHLHEPFPILFSYGSGSKVWDVDGNSYVDYLLAYGSLILGHCHPRIIEALRNQAERGTMLGTTTELELEVARKIAKMVPNAEMVSFTNTGTEATMEAIRIARAVTGKDKIVKFEGHYHGHHDYVLFSVVSPSAVAGLEFAPHKLPFSPGIPEEVSRTVIVAPWNNPPSLERILHKNAHDVAAVICEPIMGSSGVIPPADGFLKELRELTEKHDVLLIFDEVLTGFRISLGGAQEYYGVKPDLSCFAKAIGGGVPIAALTGRSDVMRLIGPRKIGYGGTYNANSLSLAGANATIEELAANDGEAIKRTNSLSRKLMAGLEEIFDRTRQKAIVQGVGSMMQIYFTKQKKIRTYRDCVDCDFEKYRRFRDLMVANGVYFHPDGTERLTLSTVHSQNDVDFTLAVAEEVLKQMDRKE